jgi:hypothetical protein
MGGGERMLHLDLSLVFGSRDFSFVASFPLFWVVLALIAVFYLPGLVRRYLANRK